MVGVKEMKEIFSVFKINMGGIRHHLIIQVSVSRINVFSHTNAHEFLSIN